MSAIKALLERKMGLLFEGKHCTAIISPAPMAEGHCWIVPKEAYPILEQTPDFVVSEMFIMANKVAMALFEALGCQGTTMLLQNGTGAGQSLPHTIMHVIPRKEDDGLQLAWQTKQFDEETMSTVEIKIKEETKNLGVFEKEKPKPVEEKKPEEVKKDDWRKIYLRRTP